MKTQISILKTPFLAACAAVLLTCSASYTRAQGLIIPAVKPDNTVIPFSAPINTANIDYSAFCGAACIPGSTQLSALVIDAGPFGPMQPTLYVNDQGAGTWSSVALPLPAGAAVYPDVVIGNDLSSPLGNFLVGVVTVPQCPMGSMDIRLFIYQVVGPTPYTLNPAPVAIIPISTSCNAQPPVHIDIEAQYSISYMGMPLSNNFTVTWQDLTNGIVAFNGTLNPPYPTLPITPTIINSNTNLVAPDVAMVERLNPGTLSMEDWALFTYIDPTTTPMEQLFYQEWQVNPAASPSAPILYDASQNYQYNPGLRIDAIDDYNFNSPGSLVYTGAPPPTTAFFDIVANAQNLPISVGGLKILEYNNILGPGSGFDLTSPIPGIGFTGSGPGFNMNPTVACGPGPVYTVGYMNMGFGGGGTTNAYFATPVDWSLGVPPGAFFNAYEINMAPMSIPFFPPPPFSTPFAMSATCNTDAAGTQQLFTAYGDASTIYDKYDMTAYPYGFRHTSGTAPTIVYKDWKLYPNPAVDEVTLAVPGDFNAKDGGTYHITDLSGREMLNGSITGATQQIDIRSLSAGMYLLNANTASAGVKTIKFAKE